jgi:gluconokinase
MIVVLMGVTGSGKSTIGELLASRTAAVFADADDYHPEANKKKMAAGHPLNDDDRQPWLETLNKLMRGWFEAGKSGILACSALKPKEIIAERLAARHHEFMNPNLLQSQFDTLEPPADALRIVNDRAPEQVVESILEKIPAAQKTSK